MRRYVLSLMVIAALCGAGCAGPAKLAEKSEDKLAEGDVWKAWELATRALDKAPANERARGAATAAANAIASDWQRRISALAAVDSLDAAEEVLKFAQFRADAIPYTTVRCGDEWMQGETRLRLFAARTNYGAGLAASKSNRPKKAYAHFNDVARFVSNYKDAAARADAAFELAQTRVAIVPLRTAAGNEAMGREVASAWSGALVEHLSGDDSFTRILATEAVERQMRVRDLGRSTRADAVRIGEKAGADRVVWGQIGAIDSRQGVQFFRSSVWHRVAVRDESGRTITQWVEVPIEVIARTRRVRVDLAYEIVSTKGGVTLSRQTGPRTLDARAVWTAYVPDGEPDSYVLVTDEFRSAHPERTKQIEFEWQSAMGKTTTVAQVMQARRDCMRQPYDRAAAIGRYAAGAAFVMLEDLPSTQELAQAALMSGWTSVKAALVELDAVDDVDVRTASATNGTEE
jgi:hypothetical protein